MAPDLDTTRSSAGEVVLDAIGIHRDEIGRWSAPRVTCTSLSVGLSAFHVVGALLAAPGVSSVGFSLHAFLNFAVQHRVL